jgi:hypothetical protein
MRQGLIVIGDVHLLTFSFLDIGDPASTFDADGVASLSMNEVLCYVCRVELLLLKQGGFIRYILGILVFIEVDEVKVDHLPEGLIKRIRALPVLITHRCVLIHLSHHSGTPLAVGSRYLDFFRLFLDVPLLSTALIFRFLCLLSLLVRLVLLLYLLPLSILAPFNLLSSLLDLLLAFLFFFNYFLSSSSHLRTFLFAILS